MRTFKSLVCFVVLSLVSSSAFALLPNTQYFNFSAYDQTIAATPAGQNFVGVVPGLNVNVKALGTFDVPVFFNAAGNFRAHYMTPTDPQGMTKELTLRFTFSQPLDVVVKSGTVDGREKVKITSAGAESYFHDYGAAPTITPSGTGIQIQGNGFGINPTGAARGETLIPGVSLVNVTYSVLADNKFEFFMVGRLVPEPSGLGAIGMGLLVFLRRLRSRG